jgi:hypothetical protein
MPTPPTSAADASTHDARTEAALRQSRSSDGAAEEERQSESGIAKESGSKTEPTQNKRAQESTRRAHERVLLRGAPCSFHVRPACASSVRGCCGVRVPSLLRKLIFWMVVPTMAPTLPPTLIRQPMIHRGKPIPSALETARPAACEHWLALRAGWPPSDRRLFAHPRHTARNVSPARLSARGAFLPPLPLLRPVRGSQRCRGHAWRDCCLSVCLSVGFPFACCCTSQATHHQPSARLKHRNCPSQPNDQRDTRHQSNGQNTHARRRCRSALPHSATLAHKRRRAAALRLPVGSTKFAGRALGDSGFRHRRTLNRQAAAATLRLPGSRRKSAHRRGSKSTMLWTGAKSQKHQSTPCGRAGYT